MFSKKLSNDGARTEYQMVKFTVIIKVEPNDCDFVFHLKTKKWKTQRTVSIRTKSDVAVYYFHLKTEMRPNMFLVTTLARLIVSRATSSIYTLLK